MTEEKSSWNDNLQKSKGMQYQQCKLDVPSVLLMKHLTILQIVIKEGTKSNFPNHAFIPEGSHKGL